MRRSVAHHLDSHRPRDRIPDLQGVARIVPSPGGMTGLLTRDQRFTVLEHSVKQKSTARPTGSEILRSRWVVPFFDPRSLRLLRRRLSGARTLLSVRLGGER